MGTILYPSDCSEYDVLRGFWYWGVVLFGVVWTIQGFGLLMGNNRDDERDEDSVAERARMVDTDPKTAYLRV